MSAATLDPASVTGLVLAGGQASRMQSGPNDNIDKGLLELHGQPLVAHAAQALRPWVSGILISANRNLTRYAAYGSVVADDPRFGVSQGPLAGLATAMAQVRTPWVAVVPVDVPLLPEDLVSRLSQAVVQEQCALAYAATTRPHPLSMVAAVSLLGSLQDFLLRGERRVMQWVREQGGIAVPFQGDGVLDNINTPEDLARLRQGESSRVIASDGYDQVSQCASE